MTKIIHCPENPGRFNAVAETVFLSFEAECVYKMVFKSREQARSREYFSIESNYNWGKPSCTLWYLNPAGPPHKQKQADGQNDAAYLSELGVCYCVDRHLECSLVNIEDINCSLKLNRPGWHD